MTKHDPTDEAETLPGIPKAGSDLEGFPSVPGLQAGAAISLDVRMQEVTSSGTGDQAAPVSVPISAVDLDRTYVVVQGSQQPPTVTGGAITWDGERRSVVWQLLSTTAIIWWTHVGGGLTKRVTFQVIEYL